MIKLSAAIVFSIACLIPSTSLAFSGDSLLAKWSHLITSPMNSSSDLPIAVTTDAAGSLIVTGRSEGVGSAFDILTVKYDQQGRVVWSRRYDGWHRGFDIPSAVAVDSDGNVFVAGTSEGADSCSTDIVVLKYSSSGEEQWVARYDGSPIYSQGESYGSADVAADLAVDENGNAFVCGMQGGISGNRDIITVKYGPDGTEEWANAFDSEFHREDNAAAIAVDQEGNAVVTGWIRTPTWDQNMITIKYSTYGEQLWDVRYRTTDLSTIGKDIAVGPDGSVFVTGDMWVWYNWYDDYRYDIITVKYGPDGVLRWLDIYDTDELYSPLPLPRYWATQLALDEDGSLYVLGGSDHWNSNSDSLLTIKYSPAGSRSWVRSRGDGNGWDLAPGGIVTGPDESILVLGFADSWNNYAESARTFCYNPLGDLLWEESTSVPFWPHPSAGGIAADGLGNSFVFAPTESGAWSDFLLRSFSSTGEERWVVETDGGGSCVSFVRDALTVAAGNTIVAGALVDSTGLRDFFTAKYDSTGRQSWYRTFGGVTGGDDGPFAATTDSYGNVYVTGTSEGVGYDKDYLTIKYNPAGVEQWSERFHSSMNDRAYHVQVDADGNVIVAGYPSLVKYDADGLLLWSVNTGEGPVSAMAVNDSGNILVLNQSAEYLRMYSGDGGLVWSNSSEAGDLAIGDDGSVFTSWALGTTKYDADGAMMWQKPVEGGNWVKVVNGRVIVGGHDSLFVLTEDGIVEWRRPGLPGWIRDGDVAAVGSDGSIYLSGIEVDVDGDPTGRLHVVQYSGDGDLLRSGVYDDIGRGEFRPFYISPDADGDVIVVGEKAGRDYSTLPFILNLSGDGLFITGVTGDGVPQKYALSQNYPNPFNGQTTISYSVGSPESILLRVHDILGREVATLVNERKAAGPYSVRWDAVGLPSGVYFYRLQAGSFSETRKLMLLK